MRAHMHTITRGFIGAAMLAVLAACGSGLDSGTGTTGSGSSAVQLGSGNGASFVKGVLELSSKSISAGGSVTVTATLVDSSGTLFTTSTPITFNSPCVSAGTASITDSSGGSSGTITATSGTAIATYTAKGCKGSDTITATATVNSAKLTATATLTVASAALGSIQFVSASPSTITLRGMGGAGLQQTSTVIFAVKDSVGGPVSGANVTFSLVSSTGGVLLSQTSVASDANGNVQTIVQAGTHSGPVVVQASIVVSGQTISTTSSGLAIQSGIPSQQHFSLAVDTFNPEGFDIDGNQATLTVHLADRFGNPVPNLTTVSFIQSGFQFGAGGNVQGSCATSGGTCSVLWTSQDPRPSAVDNNQHIGFAYVLAFANGEESFTDTNGDGVFDDASGVAEPFDDLAEIFAPSAEFANCTLSGTNPCAKYVSGETFYDFNSNGSHDGKDGLWEGVKCGEKTGLCSNQKNTGVGTATCIVMSGSTASFSSLLADNASVTAPGGIVATPAATSFSAAIADENGNVLPAKTTITLDTSNLTGATAALAPATSGTFTVGNTGCAGSVSGWPARFVVNLTVNTPPVSGTVGILVTTPSNTVSEIIFTVN